MNSEVKFALTRLKELPTEIRKALEEAVAAKVDFMSAAFTLDQAKAAAYQNCAGTNDKARAADVTARTISEAATAKNAEVSLWHAEAHLQSLLDELTAIQAQVPLLVAFREQE